MRSFRHISARTTEEACELLAEYKGKAVLNAGGTDLLLSLKGENLFNYPELIIDIKTIPNLDYIREDKNTLSIGALTKLSNISDHPLINKRYLMLGEAARSVATPQIRNVATIGGNLCQDVRCWYYRYPGHIGGPIRCMRKGNGPCPAVAGDNRYHAIMGGKKCFAVCPSDIATALAALDSRILVTGIKGARKIALKDFFNPLGKTLSPDEMVVGLETKKTSATARQKFLKFTLRKPVDFAIVSVATVVYLEKNICTDAHIALGAVAPGPVRAIKAEEFLKGKVINSENISTAANEALSMARPLSRNAYKLEIAKALVKRSLSGD